MTGLALNATLISGLLVPAPVVRYCVTPLAHCHIKFKVTVLVQPIEDTLSCAVIGCQAHISRIGSFPFVSSFAIRDIWFYVHTVINLCTQKAFHCNFI
jgi:hypothetical protein